MKRILLLFTLVLASGITAMAQSPELFNYQAVARDANGLVLNDQAVAVQISILSGSATGTVEYSEVHSVTTNAFGLFNFRIGDGTGATGSISGIDWSIDDYFVKVELDETGGTSFSEISTSQLVSVPYSLLANNVVNDMVDDADADTTNEIQSLSISGDTIMISGSNSIVLPVIENNDNDSTNELQTISMSNDVVTLSNGGGSVDLSGYTNSDDQMLTLSNDTLYIEDGNDVDLSGYMDNTDAQTLSLSSNTLSIQSGNSVSLSAYLDDTDDQTLSSSASSTNRTISISGGNSTTISVADNDNSSSNEIQTISLSSNTLSLSNSGGSVNLAGYLDNSDSQTLSVSGSTLSISGGNSVSLPSSTSVWSAVTTNSHYEIASFSLDAEVKYGATDLSGNSFNVGNGVFWGTSPYEDTGMFTDGDQLILISPGDNQLIQFWEEDSHQLRAQINQSGTYSSVSDRNLKQNIEKIEGGLDKILALNGYTYEYKQAPEDIEKGQSPEKGIGVIAQELVEVAPVLTTKTQQGHYVVNYDGLIPILIEAMKEQQAQIDALTKEVEELKR